jgi:hypothetical protein
MTPAPRIDPSAIRKEMKAFITANDAQGFVELCQAVKAEVLELVVADRAVEGHRLLEVYSNVLNSYECANPAFTLKILPILPSSSMATVKLLGINDEIDSYILEHKIDLQIISHVKDGAYAHLIHWALKKKDLAYVEKVVLMVTETLHTESCINNAMILDASICLLYTLVDDENTRMTYTPAIDDAVASLLIKNNENKQDCEFYLSLAMTGMRKTLMSALRLQFFYPYSPPNEERRSILVSALPEQPTAKELHWIHRSLSLHGIAAKILFDDTVDMLEYIDALKDSYQGKSRFNDLSYATLASFTHLLDNQQVNTSSKKKRVALLLNEVCEQEAKQFGFEKTPEKVRNELLKMGVPESLIRTVKMLKVVSLEDALGL